MSPENTRESLSLVLELSILFIRSTELKFFFSRARNDYDEETAYESYMSPEPGFQSGPGDSVDAD